MLPVNHADCRQIIRNAVYQGYVMTLVEWENKSERESGCPSLNEVLSPREYVRLLGKTDGPLNFPENRYDEGCVELRFEKEGDVICFYHAELGDTFIAKEAYEAFMEEEKLGTDGVQKLIEGFRCYCEESGLI